MANNPVAVVILVYGIFSVVSSQSPPVFLGQSSPAIRPSFESGGNPTFSSLRRPPMNPSRNSNNNPPRRNANFQTGGSNNFRATGSNANFGRLGSMLLSPRGRIPVNVPQRMQQQQQQQQQQSEQIRQRQHHQQQHGKWAPGEPVRTFPGDPRVRSCRRSGCPRAGSHCVFWGGMCPTSVRGVPCRCERGCRVDKSFIPFGQSRVMDACNNICRCNSREGQASCTTRRC